MANGQPIQTIVERTHRPNGLRSSTLSDSIVMANANLVTANPTELRAGNQFAIDTVAPDRFTLLSLLRPPLLEISPLKLLIWNELKLG